MAVNLPGAAFLISIKNFNTFPILNSEENKLEFIEVSQKIVCFYFIKIWCDTKLKLQS